MNQQALTDFLRRAQREPEPMSATQREAAVLDLQADFARYSAPCPFKPGDLVTPRHGNRIRGAGDPHIVLEVAEQPVRIFEALQPEATSQPNFGQRLDMRVLASTPLGRAAYWVESFEWKPYGGEA